MWSLTHSQLRSPRWLNLFLTVFLSLFLMLALLLVMQEQPSVAFAQQNVSCVGVSEIVPQDCAALAALYNSANGKNWETTHAHWFSSTLTPCSTPWDGVTCVDRRVISLHLNFYGLTGTLPSELGNLTELISLQLAGDIDRTSNPGAPTYYLQGQLPESMKSLTNLQELFLAWNQISGDLPAWLGELHSLRELVLDFNPVTGPIPTSLLALSLTKLSLNGTQISGRIPPELGTLDNLNQLSHLYLSSPGLVGEIPPELGKRITLKWLIIDGQHLTGSLSWIPSLTNLSSLWIAGEGITGQIPSEIDKLTSLTSLALIGNGLTGTIPSSIASLGNLGGLRIQGDNLSGGIPPQLGSLTNLQTIHIQGVNLNGKIPPQLGNLSQLWQLYIQNTGIGGSIPATLGGLSKLETLVLHNNKLEGGIPPQVASLPNLIGFFLSSNRLSGVIPPELFTSSPKLGEVVLENNHLEGPLPVSVSQALSLTRLTVQANRLRGGLSSLDWSRLVNLQILNLSSNQFTEEIPVSLCNLPKISGVDINYNRLTAADPKALGCLKSGWEYRQTVAPKIQIGIIKVAGVDVSLTPAADPDLSGPGGYIVTCLSPTDPVTITAYTPNKSPGTLTVKGLHPAKTYSCTASSHTLPNGEQQNELQSDPSLPVSVRPVLRVRTDMLLALDSNLDKNYDDIVNQLKAATWTDADKVVLALVDRRPSTDTLTASSPQADSGKTRILLIFGGRIEEVSGLPDPTQLSIRDSIWCSDPMISNNPIAPGSVLTEYDMANCAHLGAFIRWAWQTYPAPTATLSYVGHGVPLAPATDISGYITNTVQSVSTDATSSVIFPAPGGQDAHPGELTDETSRSLITPYALAQALRIGTNAGANPYAVLDIVHCFGATIEEFYELANPGGRPFAKTMIGSPNYAFGGGLVFQEALLAVQPGQSAQAMASTMLKAYDRALDRADQSDGDATVEHPRILVGVDRDQILILKQRVDDLASALIDSFKNNETETRTRISKAHLHAGHYDTTLCRTTAQRPRDWKLNEEDGVTDLADLALQLHNQFSTTTSITVVHTADAVIAQVNATLIDEPIKVDGYPWFITPTVTTTMPISISWTFAKDARGIGIYTDFKGYAATKSNEPTATVTVLGWQAHWYTPENRPTVEKPEGDNPHPYAFVRQGNVTFSHVLQQFWSNRIGQVETRFCTTKLPDIQFIHWLYMPLVQR